jgi:3-methyladenine DNA glycosylase/8-oxoguanine DNA glycosylase
MSESLRLRLTGAGGEPVDLWRTFLSHGVASLPPMRVDEGARTLEVTVPLDRGKPRTVLVKADGTRYALIDVAGRAPSEATARQIAARVAHILRLDEDLSPLYERCAADQDLAWICRGAGRMIRSATVFEEVIKSVCTTNCAWSATERMVAALVEHLGEPSPTAPKTGPYGRAFPRPEAMAEASERFYRDTVRAGYRGAYMKALAASVAEGRVDLEVLGTASADEIPDEEVEERLLALPGVGPYAAAHIMMMIGRYSPLILDSWTRPKYARLVGKKKVADPTILRRFRPYGEYAGLAFWLFVTSDWVEETKG